MHDIPRSASVKLITFSLGGGKDAAADSAEDMTGNGVR